MQISVGQHALDRVELNVSAKFPITIEVGGNVIRIWKQQINVSYLGDVEGHEFVLNEALG